MMSSPWVTSKKSEALARVILHFITEHVLGPYSARAVLILAGANRMSSPDSVLLKVLGIMLSLAPSQTAGWFMISLIVLVILLALIFTAGCILIARLETRAHQTR